MESIDIIKLISIYFSRNIQPVKEELATPHLEFSYLLNLEYDQHLIDKLDVRIYYGIQHKNYYNDNLLKFIRQNLIITLNNCILKIGNKEYLIRDFTKVYNDYKLLYTNKCHLSFIQLVNGVEIKDTKYIRRTENFKLVSSNKIYNQFEKIKCLKLIRYIDDKTLIKK